jgi:hypothetical protein
LVLFVAIYHYPELTKSRKKAADYYIACWTGWGGRGWAAQHYITPSSFFKVGKRPRRPVLIGSPEGPIFIRVNLSFNWYNRINITLIGYANEFQQIFPLKIFWEYADTS